MITHSLFAFLHFVAAFGIASTLFFEWLTFGKNLTLLEAKRIQRCDRWYGIFAAVILVAGFLRVFYFEKGSAFYFSNPFFLAKLSLFLLIGLLSIYPTVKFIGWSKSIRMEQPPVISDQESAAISFVLGLQMWLLAALVLCASLMAKGISL
jgi:putative membrane protein